MSSTRTTATKTSISPWLSVRNAAGAVKFYKEAFGADEVFHLDGDSGSVVSRLSVGGAEFWIADESPEYFNFSPESLGGSTTRMVLSVADPDAVFARAIDAGAKQVQPVSEMHGWRVGRVMDPFGHHWEIGKMLQG